MASEDVSFQCILRVAAPALLLNGTGPRQTYVEQSLLACIFVL